MAIEFRCPNCDKKLRTGDDKGGKTAKCPQCGSPVTVPVSSTEVEEDFSDLGAYGDFEVSPEVSAAGRSSSRQLIACPMCGANNDTTANRCYACGEDLGAVPGRTAGTLRPGSGQIDLGLALSDGWAVFRDQLGGALALTLVAGAVMFAIVIPIYMLFIGGMVALMAAGGGPNAQPSGLLLGLMQIVFMLVLQLGIWFVSIGFTRALLLLVRGKQLDVGAVFSGGRYYGLMALNSLVVFGITQGPNLIGQLFQQPFGEADDVMVGIGLFLSLVSLVLSVIVYPCIWPYTYIIVDDRTGRLSGLEPLRRAWRITPGSRLLSFALFLVLGIINMAGVFALCIGVFFTTAYMMITLTVAYEQLSPKVRQVSSTQN